MFGPVNFGGVPFMLSNHHPVQSVESYGAAARFSPSFSLYRPPIDIPYASLYPPTYQAGAHLAAPPYYRGFALLPPPGPGFVPVALADSYSAYALAGPPPLAGPANGDLSYYLHRYPLAPPPCGSLSRYLPTPCSLANGDWRAEPHRSITELSSASTSVAMHDDRNLLPLAGAEAAAATSSASAASSSANSSAGKVDAAGHPVPTRTFCPLDAIAPLGSAPPNSFASRCLPGSCSCSGQSTLRCPKNVLAGPLTGEGKRSEPNSPSQSVIPHPSLEGVTPQSGPNGATSPQVPLETAADPPERNNNDERIKQKPVSSRLRRPLEPHTDHKPKKAKTQRKQRKSLKNCVTSDVTTEMVPAAETLAFKESKRSMSRSPSGWATGNQPPRWSNGWSWLGPGFLSPVHVTNDDAPVVRRCYRAMKHRQGDVVHTRDCILLKSGPKAKDVPYVAKVSALWENADDGEMMMSLLWYYRPEHTDAGRKPCDLDDEIFASRHRDVCSVACVEDKCYVLTFNEYCRYRKQSKMVEEGFTNPPSGLVPPPGDGPSDYPRRMRLPSACTPPDRVFLCRKVYDFRQKRILKNPT